MRRKLKLEPQAQILRNQYRGEPKCIQQPSQIPTSQIPTNPCGKKGDFTQIAAFMRQSGEGVIQSLQITPPLHVLDLGCGDGTTAVPLARPGRRHRNRHRQKPCRSREQTRQGSRSSESEVSARRRLPSGIRRRPTFDLTVSIFGAMFAPRPFDVAREMVRVTRPGGRIVMGNWIPNDPTFVSQLLKISSRSLLRLRKVSSVPCPGVWRVTSSNASAKPAFRKKRLRWSRTPTISPIRTTPPAQFIDLFEAFYGPTMNAVEAAGKNGKAPNFTPSWWNWRILRIRAKVRGL